MLAGIARRRRRSALLYAVLYTKLGVPSFVFSLAGLLGFQGALLYVLGDERHASTCRQRLFLLEFTRFKFLSPAGVLRPGRR